MEATLGEVRRTQDPAYVLVSPDQTHLFWAETPEIQAPRAIYRYDLSTLQFERMQVIGDAYFESRNLASSNGGERLLHYQRVYDRDFNNLGSLGSASDQVLTVGIAADGSVAVVYRLDSHELRAYDLTANTSAFPVQGKVVSIPMDPYGAPSFLAVTSQDQSAFAFVGKMLIVRRFD